MVPHPDHLYLLKVTRSCCNHNAILTSVVIHSNSLMSRNTVHIHVSLVISKIPLLFVPMVLGPFHQPLSCVLQLQSGPGPGSHPVPCTSGLGRLCGALSDYEQLPTWYPLPSRWQGHPSTKLVSDTARWRPGQSQCCIQCERLTGVMAGGVCPSGHIGDTW